MIDNNILNEDFISLENEFGSCEKARNKSMQRKHESIKKAVKNLRENMDMGDGAFFSFKYEPIVEELLEMDIFKETGFLSQYVKLSENLSLYEATVIGHILNSQLSDPSSNDLEVLSYTFSKDGADISNYDGNFFLNLNDRGRSEAIRKLKNFAILANDTQAAVNSLIQSKNFEEIDYLEENLSNLIEISVLFEGTNPSKYAETSSNIQRKIDDYEQRQRQARYEARRRYYEHGGEDNFKASGYKSNAEAEAEQRKMQDKK